MAAYGENTAWSVIRAMGLPVEDFTVSYVLSEEKACYAFHRDTPNALVARFQRALDGIVAEPLYLKLLETYFLNPPSESPHTPKD